jgi:hypothetical protein
MPIETVRSIGIILTLTLISGMGDAYGFVHSARVWQEGKLLWIEIARSSAGFAVGMSAYWLCVRFLNEIGDFTPEMQTLAWFVVTMVGIAFVSRAFFEWQTSEQLVALSIVGCMGWLLARTGG